MVGAGESYLALFALAAGLGEVASGLIATVPLLAGAVLQTLGPAGVRLLGTYRRWIVACAATQALSFAPLAAMALLGRAPVWLLFGAATLYWGAGMATGTAWSTWIGQLVPGRVRARYFGRRSRIANAGILVGLVGAGLTLEHGPAAGNPLLWYALIFAVAGLARGGSAAFLASQTDTGPVPGHHRDVRGRELLARLRHGRDGRFIMGLFLVQLAVQVSQPFFTPYMREELALSYDRVLALTAASFLAKALTQPAWGRLAQRVGAMHLLWVGGLGLVPLPALWLVSSDFTYLIVAQLGAGAMWGAYEMGSFLLIFEALREEERTSLWTTYNLFNAIAMVAGSLVGAQMLHALGRDAPAYAAVFIVSGVVRLVAVAYFLRMREAVRTPVPVAMGVDAVRPSAGSITKPILPSISGVAPEAAGAVAPDRGEADDMTG